MKRLFGFLLAVLTTFSAFAGATVGAGGGGGSTPSGAAGLVYATPAGTSGNASLRALTSTDLPAYTGNNFIMVTTVSTASPSTDPVTNGTNLLAAYATAKATTTANGAPLGSDNRITLLLPAAIYDLNGGTLTCDTNYIDIVGLVTSTGEQAVIQSAVTANASGVLKIAGTGSTNIRFANVEFKNTGLGISPNTSSTTNYASVVQVTAGDMINCYFSHVVFVAVSGGNIFNPLAQMYNPSNSIGGVPVFVDCAIPSFKYLLYPGGNFIRCGSSALAQGYLGSAVGALSFIGDTASTPVSILIANFSTGTQVSLQDMTYAPNIPQVGVIFSVKSVALDGGLYLTAYPNVQGSQFGNLIGCTITNAGSKYIYMDGTYQSCVISPGKVVWGNSLCQNCILTPTANSTWVDGTGAPGGFGTTKYPKFYGCRFLAAMSLASAGTVDLNHCSLISTWGSPANLSYATSTLAAGYNVIAANTNWNSP